MTPLIVISTRQSSRVYGCHGNKVKTSVMKVVGLVTDTTALIHICKHRRYHGNDAKLPFIFLMSV